jgi:glycerol-3-phosphate dehydrogenase
MGVHAAMIWRFHTASPRTPRRFKSVRDTGTKSISVSTTPQCGVEARSRDHGLRYLENGELSLVRESLRERDALSAECSAYGAATADRDSDDGAVLGSVQRRGDVPGLVGQTIQQRRALPIQLGLSIYDLVTGGPRRLPRHSFRGGQAARALWPHLTPRLRWSATYYDAWISYPERLGMELILDTEHVAPQVRAVRF